MRLLKTASYCALLIGILAACCFQHYSERKENTTFHSEFHSKAYKLNAYKSLQFPAQPRSITKVYRKYRTKSLHVNFHFVSDDRFILLHQDPCTFLAFPSDENIPSSTLLFQGSRAPPAC